MTAAKFWTALAGAIITTGAALAAYFGIDEEIVTPIITGVGTVLTSLGVYTVANTVKDGQTPIRAAEPGATTPPFTPEP